MNENEIFPHIVEIPVQQGQASYERKCVFHERLLYHYLIRKIDGWNAGEFVKIEKIKSYCLYAITDFTDLFLRDISCKEEIHKPILICDKNAESFPLGYNDYKVISQNELVYFYKRKNIDKIIIMSILHENEIIKELLERGILINDIISFVSILFS